MNIRTFEDLCEDVAGWAIQLPRVDVLVGIPRSGLLVANLLALRLNLPLTDVERLLEGRMIGAGPRCPRSAWKHLLANRRRVLVVDDSIWSGNQIVAAKAKITQAGLRHDVIYGAVYVRPGREKLVDYMWQVCDGGQVFEWNILNHSWMSDWCVDIDGVLCRDPTVEEDDDGVRYEAFLENVKPTVVPTKPIGWIVTCRLEKYRTLTEDWLRRHGFKYRDLVMMSFPTKSAREAANTYAEFKADIYCKTRADLFIESSSREAYKIVRLTGKQVWCVESRKLVSPGTLTRQGRRAERFIGQLRNNPFEAVRKSWKLIRGRSW